MVNLTNKEKFLLEGEKYQHQLAIDKYNNYVAQSQDSILKNLFSNLVKIEEKHLAIRVFPDPGEPVINMLCPPAAAISSAFFAFFWPFTSLKS